LLAGDGDKRLKAFDRRRSYLVKGVEVIWVLRQLCEKMNLLVASGIIIMGLTRGIRVVE